jgi:hypothetical protein
MDPIVSFTGVFKLFWQFLRFVMLNLEYLREKLNFSSKFVVETLLFLRGVEMQ